MTGIQHLIIIASLCLGGFIGGVLVDLDHSGSLKDKWNNFFRVDATAPVEKGILHDKLVMLSLSVFFIGLGFGLLMHYVGDFI